jgi:hypothetical protein
MMSEHSTVVACICMRPTEVVPGIDGWQGCGVLQASKVSVQ